MRKEKYLTSQITAINRIITKLNIKIKEDYKNRKFEDEYIVLAIDSTGIKGTNRGQSMQDK